MTPQEFKDLCEEFVQRFPIYCLSAFQEDGEMKLRIHYGGYEEKICGHEKMAKVKRQLRTESYVVWKYRKRQKNGENTMIIKKLLSRTERNKRYYACLFAIMKAFEEVNWQ